MGNGSSANSSVPVQVAGVGGAGTLTNVQGLAAGNSHACANTSDGAVYCWGFGFMGQLGNNSTSGSASPVQVTGVGGSGSLTGISQVAAGSNTSCASSTSSTAYCWGEGSAGQLGNNSSVASLTPVSVVGVGGSGTLSGVSAVTAGTSHACARSSSGTVYCWGDNASGQLGANSTSASSLTPVQVVGAGGTGTLSGITAISSAPGSYHTCALSSSGTVYCWGYGVSGQLGNNSTSNSGYPVQVVGVGGTGTLSNITSISAGGSHTCAVESGGTVYCWGQNTSGQLGNNSTATGYNYPVAVHAVGGGGTLTGISAAGSGAINTCAVNSSGNVFCWGSGSAGALGNNSTSASGTPVQVHGLGGGGYLTL